MEVPDLGPAGRVSARSIYYIIRLYTLLTSFVTSATIPQGETMLL